MIRSHVASCFWMGIPVPFGKKHLPGKYAQVVLENESGDQFEIKYIAGWTGLSAGWRKFVTAHKLIEGDVLIFQLISPLKLKVYAPLTEETGKASTFHRTLFMFMCTSMNCLLQDQHEQWKKNPEKARRSVKIFRCQLPQRNPFYSSENPKYDGTDKPLAAGATLCSWCGTWKGDKVCGSCRKARYCSEKHQTAHWKSGHRTECRQSTALQCTTESGSKTTFAAPLKASNHVWPEFEIINEDESEYDSEKSDDDNNNNALVPVGKDDEVYNAMKDNFKGDADKRSWASFQVRISKAPDQVLRYLRDPKAKPLLPMSSGRPSKADIPNCTHCGKPRSFEFQVLPQLLYYFGVENEVNSLDWATIVAYTCDDSCEGSVAYKEEFAWVQLASQSM